MLSRRRIIALVVAAIVLVVGGYAYWNRGRAQQQGYVTDTVERGAIASTVTATGTVNPVTTVQVGTYVSGPIKSIYADFNSPVKKGQLVAKIDPAPFQVKVDKAQAAVANARAKVEKDRADLAFKELTLKRNRELRARNLISSNDLDTALSDFQQARAQLDLDHAAVQQAEADLNDARISLGYTDITSPVDGVVVSRNVDVGQTVAASFQTPTLFQIAQDLTKMQVDTNVSESDIGTVSAGQPATFTVDAYPGKDFQGTVAQVRNAPITVQNVVTYDVVIAVNNPDLELKPGMTATVNVITASQADALKVPLRALRFDPQHRAGSAEPTLHSGAAAQTDHGGRQPVVWVLQPDRTLRRVALRLGIRNDQDAEVVSGDLRAGDQVAVAFRRGNQKSAAAQPPSFGGRPHFR